MINWFTPNELLTYNCIFNFIVGDRGGGKSFGTLEFCVKQYLKHGTEFIYLRRYERELEDSLPTLFDALKQEGKFADHNLYVKGKNLYCDGKVMGYAVALSTSMKRKSINYSKVGFIIFEEFMVDGVTSRYLGQGDREVAVFENFYETVDRLRDSTRVFFLANAFSTVNIYFTRYGIRLKPPYKTYNRFKNDIMVCIWQDESYRQAKRNTRFYNIVKDTEYAEHAYGNKFYLDTTHFIRNKDSEAEFHFALMYYEKTYGVWVNWDKGVYYVTNKAGGLNDKNTISLTLEDNRPNNINIRRVRNMPFMIAFRRAVDENNVFYDNLETYAMLKEAVYLLRTIT